MKASIRDPKALQAVSPLRLGSYLRAAGWSPKYTLPNGAEWTNNDHPEHDPLLVPSSMDLGDYAFRVADLLKSLERFEGRSQIEILEDIYHAQADVIRPRLIGADESGLISLDQGFQAHDYARQLMLAAACAAIKPKGYFAKRKPDQALEYLKHAKFGQPQRGSYVLTIVSPVPPQSRQMYLLEDAKETPFERRAVLTLASAIHAISMGIQQVASTGELDPLLETVRHGVSANLCEALNGLHVAGQERDVEFSFSWAKIGANPRSELNRTRLRAQDFALIREVGMQLKSREPLEGAEVVGVVHGLRSEDGQQGDVTIVGTVDGEKKTVHAHLTGDNHALAVRSYEHRLALQCIGDLQWSGKTWKLLNPRLLELVEPEDE